MSHRNSLYLLFALLLVFVTNLFLYNTSEDYKFLIKKLKYKEDAQVLAEGEINDNYTLEGPLAGIETDADSDDDSSMIVDLDDISKVEQDDTDSLELSTNAKSVLELLTGEFTQATTATSLFDLTTEYPDEYLEFRADDISFYYFGGKKYDEVVDIFFAIAQGLPFSLNKNDTFAEKSFFINLNPEFQDDVVRIVFESEKEVFGLKLKKDRYNAVKKSLETLKK